MPRAILAAVALLAPAAALAGALTGPWPHTFEGQGYAYSLYQPQVQAWEGDLLRERAVVAVRDGEHTSYGLLQLEARTEVDRRAGVVHVSGARVATAQFPGVGPQKRLWRAAFEAALPAAYDDRLQRLEDGAALARAEKAARKGVRNAAPDLLFREHPAMLVVVDGEPALRPVEGAPLQRVVNTRPLLVKDPASGAFYLHLLDGWMTARDLAGPWAVAHEPPASLQAALAWAGRQPAIDLLEARPEPGTRPPEAAEAKPVAPPSLAQGAPEIIVVTRPTELVVTDGAPRLAPVADTGLVSWENTTSDVLVDPRDGTLYVLLAGRWFAARSAAGPWRFVPPKELPPAFARIPPGHPKESVLASVPGTVAAREALLANEVPQTATVRRAEARFESRFDGAPQLAPIDGTPLRYVRNSSTPVIEVGPEEWYAVLDGVWFRARGPGGPWSVATYVPAVLYTIPPGSPLHFVTYVRVYDATPDVVYVGYTPGYMGTVVTNGVVVYGTGWYARPWLGAAWYGWPYTYGYGVRVGWSSWYGWGVSCWYPWRPAGFWYGFGVGPWWGPMYVYRPAFYGWARPAYWATYHGVAPAPPRAAGGAYGQWSHAAVAAPPHPAAAMAGAARAAPPAAAVGHPGPLATRSAALSRADAPHGHAGGQHGAPRPPRRGGGHGGHRR